MKQIIDCVRGYNSAADRKRAMRMLRKQGYDHLVTFRDVQSEFALQYIKTPPEIIDDRLKVGDVILITKKSRYVGVLTVAAHDWVSSDGIYYEMNYWIVHSVTQCKSDERYFSITAVPSTIHGPYHCAFGSLKLPKDGKALGMWDCEWVLIKRKK